MAQPRAGIIGRAATHEHELRLPIAGGIVAAGAYIVGGGLLLIHLLADAGGAAPVPEPALSEARQEERAERRTTDVHVYVLAERTQLCRATAEQVAADALLVTPDDFLKISRVVDCREPRPF